MKKFEIVLSIIDQKLTYLITRTSKTQTGITIRLTYGHPFNSNNLLSGTREVRQKMKEMMDRQ